MARQNHDKTTFRHRGQLLARRGRKDFFVMIGGPCRVWPWHPPGFFLRQLIPAPIGGRQPQLPAWPTDPTGGSQGQRAHGSRGSTQWPKPTLTGKEYRPHVEVATAAGCYWLLMAPLCSPDQGINTNVTKKNIGPWSRLVWPGANWDQHLKNHRYKIHGEAPTVPLVWWTLLALEHLRLSWVPSHRSSVHYIHW